MRIAVPSIDPAALAGLPAGARVVEIGGPTMGTYWRARLAVPPAFDLVALERAIMAMLEGLVAEMSHWSPSSLLSRFNGAPAGNWTAVPPDFATVIAAALDVARRSDGAFDPAIGALVDLRGFGPVPADGVPGTAAVAEALATGGWRRLEWDTPARRLRQPGGLRLDLSGIAKGHAVDRVAATVVAHGVRHALVEVGGELAGRGLRPDGEPWWVDLETPGGVAAPLRVALHQIAVATSGDYVRGRHTLDPRTGRPVDHVVAISVLHPSAMLADAWATGLGVLPREALVAMAVREGLAVRALLRESEGIVEWISPPLSEMMG
jgi:thiamine biosynthesis lipoprotein